MKSKPMSLAITAVAFLAVLAASGCTVVVAKYSVPTVQVVDANTHAGIAGVSVSLAPLHISSGSSQDLVYGTTGAGGYVTFPDVLPGTYTVSASASNFGIAPETMEVTGYTGQTVRLVAVNVPATSSTVTFVGMWKSGWGDIDTYMSYPNKSATAPIFSGSTSMTIDDFINYAYYPMLNSPTNQPNGFIPEVPGANQRTLVWHGNLQTSTDPVSLNWDCLNGLYPETISVLPAISNMGVVSNVSVDINNAVGTPDFYTWYGTLEYYIAPKNTAITKDISTSGFTLYIFQGQTLYGKFRIDENIQTGAVSLARIHLFYQSPSSVILGIYPHRALVDATQTTAGTSSINGAKTLSIAPKPIFIKVR
jgi:hypothetical protein